jgi:transcriptional regulator with XRE-family HTH domain
VSSPPVTFSPAVTWQLRLEQGRTRRDVAAQACISPDHLKRLERGIARPSVGCLTRLAAALDVPVGSLFAHANHELVTK